jgi:hypothetical protein
MIRGRMEPFAMPNNGKGSTNSGIGHYINCNSTIIDISTWEVGDTIVDIAVGETTEGAKLRS